MCLEDVWSYERDVSMMSLGSATVDIESVGAGEKEDIEALNETDTELDKLTKEEERQKQLDEMITVRGLKEGEELDGFALFGLVVKLVDPDALNIEKFEFGGEVECSGAEEDKKGYEADTEEDGDNGRVVPNMSETDIGVDPETKDDKYE